MKELRYRFIIYFLLLTLIFSIPCVGGEQKKKEKEENESIFSMGVQVLGPTMIGGYAEYVLFSRFFLSGVLGVYTDYQAGINFSLLPRQKRMRWYPYLGVHYSSVVNKAIDPGEKQRSGNIYIPFGLRFESKSDFVVMFELGYSFIRYDFGQLNTQRYTGGVRIGTFF